MVKEAWVVSFYVDGSKGVVVEMALTREGTGGPCDY